MNEDHPRSAVVVVAHPDDEILWCGGLMLRNPHWQWAVVTLCRASDKDRAPRFRRVIQRLNARGVMGDLDDGSTRWPEISPSWATFLRWSMIRTTVAQAT